MADCVSTPLVLDDSNRVVEYNIHTSLQALKEALVIDLRPIESFKKKRFKHSICVPIAVLNTRYYTLPPRHVQLALLGAPEIVEKAVFMLQDRGYLNVGPYFYDSEDMWAEIESSNLVAFGENEGEDKAILDGGNIINALTPAPPLKRHIATIETATKCAQTNSSHEVGRVCDIGCGNGRDFVWLLSRGWSGVAVDNDKVSLELLSERLSLTGYADLPGRVSLHHARIMGDGSVRYLSEREPSDLSFSEQTFDLVLCVRFLQRDFLKQMASMVAPGGFILYSTFLIGAEKCGGPTNRGRLLLRGELAKCFGDSQGFEILEDRVELLADGRPVQSFLARRNILS